MAELMTVIAVVIMFTAIMIPVAGNASAKSKSAACTDNLRQCQTAAAAYINDNAGQVVLKSHDFNHMTLLWGMVSGRSPMLSTRENKAYLNSFKQTVCPSLKGVIPEKNSAAAGNINNFYAVPYMAMKKRGGYANSEHESLFYDLRNRDAYFQLDTVAGSTVVDTVKLRDPSAAMLFTEIWSEQHKNAFYHYSFNNKTAGIDLRHNNRTNIAFFDGHVKAVDITFFEDLKDNNYILDGGATGYLFNSRNGKKFAY